jgi:serine O-acetyltransferase
MNCSSATASKTTPSAVCVRGPVSHGVGFLTMLRADLRLKALWLYESDSRAALLKTVVTDGTTSMILYRLMQWSGRRRLWLLEMLFNKLNTICGNCIIGRGAEFGPGFVLIHSSGVVINGRVKGESNIYIEHQVTIGAERRDSPLLGSDIFIGAGAKILGAVQVGDGARIGANAVVIDDVLAHTTVIGIPARVVRSRGSQLRSPTPGIALPDASQSEMAAEDTEGTG